MTFTSQMGRTRSILAAATAVALALSLLTGCKSPSGVKELSKPLTDNPLAAAILNPRILSPGNREFLRLENLFEIQKRDPDAANT